MSREEVTPPRTLADEHTLIAQRYAGALVGHPYRNDQQSTVITVDRAHPWREPAVVSDNCLFCVRLTDEEAIRRVEGFQHQIDIEATRVKYQYLTRWLEKGSPDVPNPGHDHRNRANLRRFCELFQDMPTERRPNGWRTKPFPMVALPLRLKRKMCVEWNHLYLRWMEENGLQYDWEQHVFWHEVESLSEVTFPICTACAAELGPDAEHADGCTGVAGEPIRRPPGAHPPADLSTWMGYGGYAPAEDCHS
jgi:hypothetical protein